MQPNDQQGFYRPDQGQPAVPAEPQPAQPAPIGVTPAAVDAALAQAPPVEAPVAVGGTVASVGTEEEFDDEGEIDLSEPVTWTAHEYLHQEKGAMWFILFTVIMLVLIGLSIWQQAWSFTALIVVIAIVVFVYLRRPPRELTYSLSEEGLMVDQKLYKYESFKSFGIIRDGEEFSVMLIPTQRLQPGVTVYFPEEAGEDIVDVLGSVLPMKDLKLDMVDRLVRMLRL